MRIKRLLPAALVVGALILQGCGTADSAAGTGNRTGSGPATVNDVLSENMAKEDEKAAEEASEESAVVIAEEEVPAAAAEASTEEPQDAAQTGNASAVYAGDEEAIVPEGDYIDLTALSGTMIYSEVYNMMYYPENYVGKVSRMEGAYSQYYDEATGKNFYGCIRMDATACCAQGVEFEPTEDYTYPDDFPKEGETITVEGTFDLYEEDGYTYCTLRNASMWNSGG